MKKVRVPQHYTGLQLFQSTEFLTTASTAIDNLLGGGLPTRGITELCGPFSSGKTQLCFQLCCTAQLPRALGGLDGAACYITNQYQVQLERLKEIGSYVAAKQPYES